MPELRRSAKGKRATRTRPGFLPWEAIAADIGPQARYSRFSPEEVIVSPGGKPNLFFPTLALVEPGDEVIYPNPGFPTYEAMIGVAGGVPVPVPLLEANNFSFDLDAFDQLINKRTKLIILNSPSNPTGGVIPRADLEHIAEQARNSTAGSCPTRSTPGLPTTGWKSSRLPRCPA